jgi:integrase
LGKVKKYKKGINYLKNVKEKEVFGNALARDLHEKLKKGWNPFVSEEVPDNDIYFASALEFALNEKKERLADKSFSTYKNSLVHILKAIKSLGLQYVKIQDVKRYHIRAVLKKVRSTRNLSNHARNKYLSQLSAIMSELLDHDIIEYNPCHKIKPLPVGESNANETATDREHKIIKQELETNHPNFYDFVVMLYHTGIRPKELLSIKLSMIDLENREINLPPNITKTRKNYRKVIICDELYLLLSKRKIITHPQNYYLFGSFRKTGKGNIGKHEDFIIGSTKIKRDTATKRWQKIVKKQLGINKNLYSYKAKGGDDKLKAGISLDSIRNQYGHSSKKMTEIYVKEITGFYKDEIIKNSTNF